jgi:hypothetical protein
MLTTFEVAVHTTVVVVLPLLFLYPLVTGRWAPETGWFAECLRVERYLNLAGNLFLLAIWAHGAARLGLHLGYIGAGAAEILMPVVGWTLSALWLAYLVLWIRAIIKVRREGRASA